MPIFTMQKKEESAVIGQKKKFVAKKKKLFVAKHLSEKMEKIKMGQEKEIIVTWSRASTIIPSMVGHTISIHNRIGSMILLVNITRSYLKIKKNRENRNIIWRKT
jgi:ribosomal protein S19